MDKLGYGPRIDSFNLCDDKLIIYMEKLHKKLSNDIIKEREKEIINFIISFTLKRIYTWRFT